MVQHEKNKLFYMWLQQERPEDEAIPQDIDDPSAYRYASLRLASVSDHFSGFLVYMLHLWLCIQVSICYLCEK